MIRHRVLWCGPKFWAPLEMIAVGTLGGLLVGGGAMVVWWLVT